MRDREKGIAFLRRDVITYPYNQRSITRRLKGALCMIPPPETPMGRCRWLVHLGVSSVTKEYYNQAVEAGIEIKVMRPVNADNKYPAGSPAKGRERRGVMPKSAALQMILGYDLQMEVVGDYGYELIRLAAAINAELNATGSSGIRNDEAQASHGAPSSSDRRGPAPSPPPPVRQRYFLCLYHCAVEAVH